MVWVYIITYLFEALIFWYYCEGVFKGGKYNINRFWISIAIHIILLGVFLLGSVFLSAIAIISFYVCYIKFLCNASLKSSFFHAILLNVGMVFAEYISYIFITLGRFELLNENKDMTANYIFMLVSKLMYFNISFLLKKYFTRSNRAIRQALSNGFILQVAISSILVCVMFGIIDINYSISNQHKMMILCMIVVVFFTNVIMVVFNEYLNRKTEEHHMLQLQFQKEHATIEFYKMANESYENLRILKHDIKNHLLIVQDQMETGNVENAKKYLKNIERNINKDVCDQYCENHELNVLLNIYKSKFLSQNTDFCFDIRKGTLENIYADDIVALFSNILSNAYEAIDNGDKKRFVDLSVKNDDSGRKMVITCVNSCYVKPEIDCFGNFISKKHSGEHGIGTRSIKKIVKKYNGELHTYFDECKSEFHLIILIDM